MHQLWRQSPIVPFLFALIVGIIVSDVFLRIVPVFLTSAILLLSLSALYYFRTSAIMLYCSLTAAFCTGFLLVSMHRITVELPESPQDYYALVSSLGRESPKAKNGELILFSAISDTELRLSEIKVTAIFLKKSQDTDSLQVGQTIRFRGKMQAIVPDNSFAASQIRKGVQHSTFISQYQLLGVAQAPYWELARQWIRTNILSPQNIGRHVLVKGICLGEKSGFAKESLKQYQQAGFMHLLAVSGMHIGIIASLLTYAFGLCGTSRIMKIASRMSAVFILWFYVAMVGFAPSAVRAAIMFSLFFTIDIFEQTPSRFNILAAAALFMLIFSPLLVFDIGFQLSFAAMVGIFSILRIHKELLPRRSPIIQFISEAFVVGLGAQIATLPFCLYYFGYYPSYSLFFGVFAGLIVFAIMALVFVAILAYFAGLAESIGAVIDFFAYLLEQTAQFSTSLPYSGIHAQIGMVTASSIAAGIVILLLWGEMFLERKKEKIFT